MLGLSGAKTALRFFCRDMTADNPASNRTVKYSAGEIGRVHMAEGFLPAQDALVPREKNVKATLSLSHCSVDFFKHAGRTRRGPYQRMIRTPVDAYAEMQEEN